MKQRHRGLTLVEVIAVLAAMSISVFAVSAAHNAMTEDARAARCLSNLQRGMRAVLSYTVEHNGYLPGPVHPMIFRQENDTGAPFGTEREHSLSWLLGPYITPGAPAASDPLIPNTVVDELFRCPTATIISPDRDFNSDSCYVTPVFNYVCNTWGPNGPSGSSNPGHSLDDTDPPNYFGAWFLCDSNPEFYENTISWRPKRLDSIRNASSEWAISDAWRRNITMPGGRGQSGRTHLGTFAVSAQEYLSEIPSAPFHRTDLSNAKSHFTLGTTVLPDIPFDGETNQAYMDGHVAPFVGTWKTPGQGGTVNPYWEAWSGEHDFNEPWIP
ncbi:MAG: hypothetical protein DHS20C16_05060 [Phycisphaerae bacterium]|nr:MAG: hypothetical protein DHS20C16_05060 [Phycisphaerae bacterium]